MRWCIPHLVWWVETTVEPEYSVSGEILWHNWSNLSVSKSIQVLMFCQYVKVRESLFAHCIVWFHTIFTILILGWACLRLKVLAWCLDLNGIKNKDIVKYPYHIGIENCDNPRYRYPNGILKYDYTKPPLVGLCTCGSRYACILLLVFSVLLKEA